MSDLADFLLARIAEDETQAVESFGEDRSPGTWTRYLLAECEAKRRIVDTLTDGMPHHLVLDGWEHEGWEAATRVVLHGLALPYADHPDYRPKWRL